MPFPTTVDALVDAPPFVEAARIKSSQVLGPQRITVGPAWFNVKSDQYGAVGDGVADDTTAIQAAITAAQNAGGGIVYIPPGTYKTTATLRITASKVELRGAGANSIINFVASAPFTTDFRDRAIEIIGNLGSFLQIAAGAIAVGATSFTAQNVGDAATLNVGDWVEIAEYDGGAGDIVVYDWVQVLSVAGAVVNTLHPFRTAFPNARPFSTAGPGNPTGLGFSRVTTLVQDCRIRDLFVQQPLAAQGNPSIAVKICRRSVVQNCVVNNAQGQSFFTYRAQDVTFRDCYQLFSGSEFGATTDLVVQGCTFGYVGTPGNIVQANTSALTLDFGTAHFSVVGNRFTSAGDIGLQVIKGPHDGEIASNIFGWVRRQAIDGIGMTGSGCRRVHVHHNIFEGGDGVTSKGIQFGDTGGFTVNINTADNILGPNIINNFNTKYVLPPAGRTDVIIGPDVEGARSGWEIVADSTTFEHLAFNDVTTGNARRIDVGPGIGGAGQFGIIDKTGGGMLAAFLYPSGQLKTQGGVSPGVIAGGFNTARLFMGAGVPTGGAAGDWFLRTDGGGAGVTHLYFNNAGTWLAVA